MTQTPLLGLWAPVWVPCSGDGSLQPGLVSFRKRRPHDQRVFHTRHLVWIARPPCKLEDPICLENQKSSSICFASRHGDLCIRLPGNCILNLIMTGAAMRVMKIRGQKDHMNIRILQSGFEAQDKGLPETMVCRILMLSWSVGPLEMANGAAQG